MALKARDFPRAWDNLWMTHHFAGSRGADCLYVGSETSVLKAFRPDLKGELLAGLTRALGGGVVEDFAALVLLSELSLPNRDRSFPLQAFG